MNKVMVVDDNAQHVCVLQALLSDSGYEVVTAANGAEALEKARDDPPALIVTDILMPVMDGFTLCRQWKADERLKRVPLVFYTATYADPKDKQFALSLGAERFLVKPADADVFLDMVRGVLAQYEAGDVSQEREPVADELVQLREYNEILVRKLEHKVEQLAEANRTLEERVAARTAQLQEANALLETFSHGVSHDLKSPLRAISGFAEFLAAEHRDSLSGEGREYLDNVVKAARQMDQLIDDMLRYAEMGGRAVSPKPVALSDVMDRIVRERRQRICDTSATVSIAEDLPVVTGARNLLVSVFGNLIDNALTYHRPGVPAEVEVGWRRDADSVVVHVRDNGIGIAPESREQVFEIFRRLDSRDERPGTGIGLAIVRKAVQLLGGDVWVESKVDEGSTFCVKLGT